MEQGGEADLRPGPSRRAHTLPRPGCGVLTALRTRWISPAPPHFERIDETIEWQVHDLATNRVTSWADTFISGGLRGTKRETVAASGGFIYVVYDSGVSHIVCKPQQRVFHQIQPPPAHGPDHSMVAMAVDAATQQYRIVQIAGWGYSPDLALQADLIYVNLYDSRVMTWRSLCSIPVRVAFVPLSSVVLDGVLYVMFEITAPPGLPLELHSCDLDTGAWRFIDVRLPHEPRQAMTNTRPQLVAAGGRLFFAGYHPAPSTEGLINMLIYQIALQGERGTVTWVTYLMWVLDGTNLPEYWMTAAPVQAVGCGDSIVVSTFLGRRWRWDAVRRSSWQDMAPFSPVEPLANGHSFFVAPFDMQMRRR